VYKRQHLKYLWQLENQEELNCDLYFDGTQSIFVLEDSEIKRFEKAREEKSTASGSAKNSDMIHIKLSDGKSLFNYKNYRTKAAISREVCFDWKKYIVKDTIPAINWELTNERKMIGQLNCQKAVATWRCSKYEVWFTSDILIDVGPWKLCGLPGLIVEAYNKTVDHAYKLTYLSSQLPENSATRFDLDAQLSSEPIFTFHAFAEKQKKEMEKIKIFLSSKAGNPDDGKFEVKLPECY
jgi:GLPGLI family protein